MSDVMHLAEPALTKIIATLGPATSDADTITKLIEAGASIFRMNFSHGRLDDHEARLEAIREAVRRTGIPVAVLGDLPGPKIRVGDVVDSGVMVEAGSRVIFQRDPLVADGNSTPARFAARYPRLVDDVQVGQRLLVNDGHVRMLIMEKHDDEIHCRVTTGGCITTGKGINLPDTDLSIPSMGDRDWECVRWAIEHDLDYLALSFVRRATDVAELRRGIERLAAEQDLPDHHLPVIAKIEVPPALANIEGILNEADGIMVARGDLGVEMDLAQVPIIQRELIAAARYHAKPCIVATQMLESMIEEPSPTRAEATDVAGAIFDGVDAVMMSGETAVGRFPVVAVEYMRRIARATEEHLREARTEYDLPAKPLESRYRTAVLAHGVSVIARDLDARFIVVWSQEGGGARFLSQYDFHINIIAASDSERALRRMQLMRGVTPVRMPRPADVAEFTERIDAHLLSTGWAREGDPCVLVAGGRIGERGATNSLAIHAVGDPTTGFRLH